MALWRAKIRSLLKNRFGLYSVGSVFYVEGARLAGSVKRGLGRSEILAGVEIDRLTPGIDPDGYHHYHNPMVRCRTSCTTASPPDSA